MTKQELISIIVKETSLTEKAVRGVLGVFQQEILKEYKNSGEVTLLDLGKLKVADRAARVGVNPKDPTQKIEIPARKVPKLAASRKLKDFVARPDLNLDEFKY